MQETLVFLCRKVCYYITRLMSFRAKREVLSESYDIRVKSLTPRQACLQVEEGLSDPPHMKHEVERMLHESAEWGRIVEVRSTEQSVIS